MPIYSYKILSCYRSEQVYDHTIIAINRNKAKAYVKTLPTRNFEHYYKIEGKGKLYVADKDIQD